MWAWVWVWVWVWVWCGLCEANSRDVDDAEATSRTRMAHKMEGAEGPEFCNTVLCSFSKTVVINSAWKGEERRRVVWVGECGVVGRCMRACGMEWSVEI